MQPNTAMKFAEYVVWIFLCWALSIWRKKSTTVPEISNFS